MTNILEILGVQNKEDVISNLLKYCINSSIDFASIFLASVCGKNRDNYTEVEAFTRLNTASSGVPNLVIKCTNNETVDVVIIENKLKAEEGDDQTERYAGSACIEDIKKRLNLDDKTVNPTYIFLTLFPDQLPESDSFRQVTYAKLKEALGKSTFAENAIVNKLTSDLCELLEQFYNYATTSPTDKALDKLQAENSLDASYLYFKAVMDQLKLPARLEFEFTFRDSRQGRRYYGAVLSKEEWHPAEMTEAGDGKWSLNPERCFNIHIEPQFNVLSGVLNLFLHYEINPYETEAWAVKNILEADYQAYSDRRNKFINALQAADIAGLIIGGGSNQIAKAALEISEEMQLNDMLKMIEGFIDKVGAAVDRIIQLQLPR